MVATVLIREKNGAGETATDKTSGTIRFKNADDSAVDLNNPLVRPPSGTEYSFEKWLRVKLDAPPSDRISNINFYMDGSKTWSAGIALYVKTTASYATPAEATAVTGYVDAFTYNSGSPLAVGASNYSATGDVGSYLVMVMTVDNTVVPGVLTGETMTISYDEI